MKRFIAALLVLFSITGALGAQKLELYYYKQENQEGLKKLVDQFVKENPGISIDLLIVPNDADATMSARAAQGKLPDILQMQSYSRVAEYAAKGYLVDLTKQPVLTKVVDSSKPAVTWNSKLWGLPMDFAGIGIIYNKDIFAKYGLKPPATYRDLERLCRTLRTNGVTPFAGLLKENWSMGHFITLVHTNLLAEKNISADKFVADMNAGKTSYGVVDTDKLFSVMDFYRANMDKNAEEWNWNEQQAAFAEGKAAMMVQGLWSYGAAIGTNPKLDCGFVPFPIYNDAGMNKFYADVDSCFGVSAQSAPDKKAAALKFLEWLATSQAQKIWVEDYKLTLSFKGADVSKLGGPFVDLMSGVGKNGAYPWAFASYPTAVFEDACKNGAQQYVFNKKTAEAVIADIDKQWAANVKK
ncbi:MAG: extracellular solute-binding protein [Spirochaetia bacterium]|jgi:raffinose/stachyose/melibiose transport system substrate-binding protein|nr:extracellular solute-binding protein [Spirochaetia bacterium]